MYDFHKIKDQEGQAFRHEKFQRDGINALCNIKRKVRETVISSDIVQRSRADIEAEYAALQKQIIDLNASLRTLSSHNQILFHTNKEHLCKVFQFKKESDLNVKKMLFVFFTFATTYYPELAEMIETTIAQVKVNLGENVLEGFPNFENIGNTIKLFINNILYKKQNQVFLDTLIEMFTRYLKEPCEHSLGILKKQWLAFLGEQLARRQVENEQNTRSSLPKSEERLTKNFGFCEWPHELDSVKNKRNSQKDDQSVEKESILDLRSENFNDLDLFGKITPYHQYSPRSIQSKNDFHKNGSNSYSLLSPKLDSKTNFKF